MSAENPISPKAIASTTGAGAGALVATLANWILGIVIWDAGSSAEEVAEALAAVPTPVAGIIALVAPAVCAAVSGWKVKDPLRVTPQQLKALHGIRG